MFLLVGLAKRHTRWRRPEIRDFGHGAASCQSALGFGLDPPPPGPLRSPGQGTSCRPRDGGFIVSADKSRQRRLRTWRGAPSSRPTHFRFLAPRSKNTQHEPLLFSSAIDALQHGAACRSPVCFPIIHDPFLLSFPITRRYHLRAFQRAKPIFWSSRQCDLFPFLYPAYKCVDARRDHVASIHRQRIEFDHRHGQ